MILMVNIFERYDQEFFEIYAYSLTKVTKKGDVIHTEKLISVRFVPMIPGIADV